MKRQCKKSLVILVTLTLVSFKYSHGQDSLRSEILRPTPEVDGSMDNFAQKPFSDQPTLSNGINIGESFFLKRLRQGDSEAFMRLIHLHDAVDTPMSLLHNFFQVFNRPDLSQRTGLFSLLHNLAVARGLLPNSLAIGSDGLPTRSMNSSFIGVSVQPSVVNTQSKFNANFPRENIRTNTASVFNINFNQSQTNVGQVKAPQTNNILGRNTQTDQQLVTAHSTSERPVGQNNTLFGWNNTVTENNSDKRKSVIRTPDLTPFQIGGRVSSPSIRTERRQFSDDGSLQRGAQFLPRNVVSRIRNKTVLKTLQELILNRTRTQPQSEVVTSTKTTVRKMSVTTTAATTTANVNGTNAQVNPFPNFKIPSNLNFLLEMPTGVNLRNLNRFGSKGKSEAAMANMMNNEAKGTDTFIEVQGNQGGREKQVLLQSMKNSESEKHINTQNQSSLLVPDERKSVLNVDRETSWQRTDKTQLNDLFSSPETRKFVLQRVGHVQLDPIDHILQLVGELNLSLSKANYTIRRVGELNIGKRRQFVMEMTVNVSSKQDKILVQRVGSTNVVPGERVQLHGTGDVRLLTKERVLIQRLGFVRFQTDPLKKVNLESEKELNVTGLSSIFRIEPLDDKNIPKLYFLGNETNVILNEESNETVLQFVGDIISEFPTDRLNLTKQSQFNFDQSVFSLKSTTDTNQRQFSTSRNKSMSTTVRENLSGTMLPVLRESVLTKSKQSRINVQHNAKIHLHSIGRFFSVAEMKFEK